MEKNVVVEQIREVIKLETEFSVKLQQPQSKSLINLKSDEQILKSQVENFKKENFSLKASVQAWKITYEQKHNELREAESKLNEIYDQIWSEREQFCAKADKFNYQYGILSKRWKEKMNEIFNPVPKKKEKYQEKKQKIEMTVEDAQKEVEVLEKEDNSPEIFDTGSRRAESFVLNRKEALKKSSPEPGNKNKLAPPAQENGVKESSTSFNELGAMEFNEVTKKLESSEKQTNGEALESIFCEMNTQIPKKKKVRFSKENDTIEIFYENPETLKMKFFSIVDTETVRKANRFKNERKNQLLGKAKKPWDKFI